MIAYSYIVAIPQNFNAKDIVEDDIDGLQEIIDRLKEDGHISYDDDFVCADIIVDRCRKKGYLLDAINIGPNTSFTITNILVPKNYDKLKKIMEEK